MWMPRELRPRIRDRGVECSPVEVRREDQLIQLRRGLERLVRRSAFYRERLQGDATVVALDNLAELPFTTKADLQAHYPLGLLATPAERIVRVHATSGTTAHPLVVPYTPDDLTLWAKVVARGLAAVGIWAGTRVHSALGYGLFTGGLGFQQGAELLRATLVPASAGMTARQLQLMTDLQAQVLLSTPSYAMHLADRYEAAGHDPTDTSLEVAVFGAEPWSEALRRRIEARWDVTAYDTYGLSEIIGPGVAFECPARKGLHVNEDHFLAEVVHTETGEPVADGELGELVLTALTKEALPLLRYRTGDLTRLDRSPCDCGRTLVRMARVLGRSDDMLTVRGVNVYPSQVGEVLLRFPELCPNYQLVVDRKRDRLDELEVRVEVYEDTRGLRELGKRLAAALHEVLGLRARPVILPQDSLPRSQGKAARVVDRRVSGND